MIGAIREYFWLGQARATARSMSDGARAEVSRQLALGRQRAEAADALWSNGHVAEGLRLAVDAFESTLDALTPFGRALEPSAASAASPAESSAVSVESREASDTEAEADSETETELEDGGELEFEAGDELEDDDELEAGDASSGDPAAKVAPAAEAPPSSELPSTEPPWAPLLRRGLSDAKAREVLETRQRATTRSRPSLDDEVTAADGELFQQLAAARRHVDRVLAPASMTPGQLTWTQVSRVGFAAFLGLAATVGLYLALRPATGVTVTGSGQWSAEFAAERAVDGDPATEWLLPDRQEGTLEVRIAPATRMNRIRLKNSHNRHYNDRATQAYTVEVYSNDELVRTVEGEWPELSPRPDWTAHELGVDDVSRVVIRVRSWHRQGGGLAEVDWD